MDWVYPEPALQSKGYWELINGKVQITLTELAKNDTTDGPFISGHPGIEHIVKKYNEYIEQILLEDNDE